MPIANPEDLTIDEMTAMLVDVPRHLLAGATAILAGRVADAYSIWERTALSDFHEELPRIAEYAWSQFDASAPKVPAPCDRSAIARIQEEQRDEWPELIEECVKVLHEAAAILETSDASVYALGVARAFGDHQYFAQLMDAALEEAGFASSVEAEELEVQRELFALFDPTVKEPLDAFRALHARPVSWREDFAQVEEL